MKVSRDDEIPNIWKVIKFQCSKPPTRSYLVISEINDSSPGWETEFSGSAPESQ
jgi:hypothetical protein